MEYSRSSRVAGRSPRSSRSRAALPFRITGNNNTFNNLRDGGLSLNGITPQDIQDRIGLYRDAAGLVYYLPPDWIAQVKADGTIASNKVPGTWGEIFYLHGPHQTFTDIGISKAVNITERVRFKFQTEILNAFNHPTFWQHWAPPARLPASTATGFGRANQTRHFAPHRVPGRTSNSDTAGRDTDAFAGTSSRVTSERILSLRTPQMDADER